MKSVKITGIVITLLLMSGTTFSQSIGGFRGLTTWKVNEYYLNTVRLENTVIDSIRYRFRTDGIVMIRNYANAQSSSTLPYTFNSSDSVITITGQNSLVRLFKVVYADSENFIFRTNDVDPVTQEALLSEYRMIPDPDL